MLITLLYKLLAYLLNKFDDSLNIYKRFITSSNPRVLEISFGSGINTYNLLRIVFPMEGFLASIDIDPFAISVGKRVYDNFLRAGLLDLDIADAHSLPYRDESFDYIVSHMTMHHIDDVEKSVSEMVRVLRRGGRIIIIDLVPSKIYSIAPRHGAETLKNR